MATAHLPSNGRRPVGAVSLEGFVIRSSCLRAFLVVTAAAVLLGGVSVGPVGASAPGKPSKPAKSSKPVTATWQGGGTSTRPVVDTRAYRSTTGSLRVVLETQQPAAGQTFVPIKATDAKNWAFAFTVPAPAAAGTYGPGQVTSVALSYGKGTSMPIGSWGTVTLDEVTATRVSGSVAVDDGYMSVRTRFAGPITAG